MNAPIPRSGRATNIGIALLDTGKINAQQATQILHYQKEHGLRFGEAAIRLGLASEADINRILALQFDYPYLQRDEGALSPELIAAYAPFSIEVEALRGLRSQLMVRWLDKDAGTNALAIVSAGRGEGRSWLAANLAVVFSQLGEHTLLVDADLRHPRQHRLFGLENQEGLSTLLSDRASAGVVSRVPHFRDLSVMTGGPTPPNPQELICCSTFQSLINHWTREYDVIIIDTPSMNQSADAQAIAGRAMGALVVARQDKTRHDDLVTLQETLNAADAKLVGAVVNQF